MNNLSSVLDARIPPPVALTVAGILAWVVSIAFPAADFAFSGASVLAVSAVVIGLALNLYPKLLFRQARTTVNPLKPYASTVLLTNGIYRHSRNPMYLGHAFILLGVSSHLENWVSLLAVPAYVAYVTQFQIKPEERALMASFPEQFARYAKATRRWA